MPKLSFYRNAGEPTRLFKKQQLMDFYKLSDRDEESISVLTNLDNDGRFKQQILNLELAMGDAALAQKRFVAQLENGAQFAADLTYFSTLQTLYKRVLHTLHLSTSSETLAIQDYHYTKDTILESGFITWIEAHRPILQGLISLPSTQQLQRDPLRFLSILLGKMGLKQKRTGRAEMGLYHLDRGRIALLNSLIMRRAKGAASALDVSSCAKREATSTDIFIDAFRKIKQFFMGNASGAHVYT